MPGDMCVPKIMIAWCTVPEIWCATDSQTEGKKEHIDVGAPPKNLCAYFWKVFHHFIYFIYNY